MILEDEQKGKAMKKITSMVVSLLLILLVALTFTNCNMNNAPIPKSSLTIKFTPDAESRTLKPDTLNLAVSTYDLNGIGPNGAVFSITGITSETYTMENLVPGEWSVIAKGKNADGIVIVQSAETMITLNSAANSLPLTLLPILGTGTFALDLSWPADMVGSPEIIATLTPDGGESIPLTFVIAGTTASVAPLTLDRGYYELSVKLINKSFDEYLVWSKVETVLLFAGATTSEKWNLVTTDMNAPTPQNLGLVLTVKTKSPIEMELSEVPAVLAYDTSMTVTASGSPVPETWKWYLDGDVLVGQTASTVTIGIGLAEKTLHTLTVIGRIGDVAGSTDVTFRIGDVPIVIDPVDLLTAGSYVILAQTAVSGNASTSVTGNIGVSPVTSTAITGFALVLDSTLGTFSTSTLVNGSVFASDYVEPTKTNLTQAVLDSDAAYEQANSRVEASAVNNLTGEIGGMKLPPGLYAWTSAVSISTNLTLEGPASGVWIFQIDGSLTQAASIEVLLSGGALPQNVFWQVGGGVSLGAGAHLEGVVLSGTGIALGAGASVDGRLFAKTAVTLDAATVTEPLL